MSFMQKLRLWLAGICAAGIALFVLMLFTMQTWGPWSVAIVGGVTGWTGEDLAGMDETRIIDYQPAVMTRVHAGDGALIAEYSLEGRVFVPIENMPPRLVQAFVSAEDQNFRTHSGVDYPGVAKAQVRNVLNCFRGACSNHGGSSITQQVAKNFFLTSDQTMRRKIVEMALAHRIERFRTKDDILELYLNEIYLGRRSYGVAAAALLYFGKSLDELTLSEMAYLGALPKAPSTLDITREAARPRAEARRNYVLGRMVIEGYISEEEAAAARAESLVPVDRNTDPRFRAAGFFVEQVRRQMLDLLRGDARGGGSSGLYEGQSSLSGDALYAMLVDELYTQNERRPDGLDRFETQEEAIAWMLDEVYARRQFYGGGLSIRTTLDTRLQSHAREALRWGLESYDRRHGYRGPLAQISVGEDWAAVLADVVVPPGVDGWSAAVVLEVAPDGVIIGLPDGDVGQIPFYVDLVPETGDIDRDVDGDGVPDLVLDIEDTPLNWARTFIAPQPTPERPTAASTMGPVLTGAGDVLGVGDVVLVELLNTDLRVFGLRQVPEVNGAILAMDPHTGRVLAMVGGYYFQFGSSELNRTRQASRQPGSSFKPFVYAAAFEEGATAADIENGGPYSDRVTNRPGEWWTPTEYLDGLGSFRGDMTIRVALEKSKNTVAVRAATKVGLERVSELAERMGVYSNLRPYPANALGAQETTVWRMVTAYSMFVNGGKRIEPTILDRVQDRTGRTVYVHDVRDCDRRCQVRDWSLAQPPELPDEREQVLSDATAFQISSVLEGVVQRGTARSLRTIGRPVAGKTGTTNNFVDAWFVGFSPDLVVGVFVGFDKPRSMGGGESGGAVAAPIFQHFMENALVQYDDIPFRQPSTITLMPIDANTGLLAPARTDGGPMDQRYRVNGCDIDPVMEAFKIGTGPTTWACGGAAGGASVVTYGPVDAAETDPNAGLSMMERLRRIRGEEVVVSPEPVQDEEEVDAVY